MNFQNKLCDKIWNTGFFKKKEKLNKYIQYLINYYQHNKHINIRDIYEDIGYKSLHKLKFKIIKRNKVNEYNVDIAKIIKSIKEQIINS